MGSNSSHPRARHSLRVPGPRTPPQPLPGCSRSSSSLPPPAPSPRLRPALCLSCREGGHLYHYSFSEPQDWIRGLPVGPPPLALWAHPITTPVLVVSASPGVRTRLDLTSLQVPRPRTYRACWEWECGRSGQHPPELDCNEKSPCVKLSSCPPRGGWTKGTAELGSPNPVFPS